MNVKRMVKISNIIGIISIVLLVYWIFIFSLIEIFKFKVFGENITQTFYFSVFGILAIMFGALMINIMFNLTRIAEKHNADDKVVSKRQNKISLISILLTFPVIAFLLFLGNNITAVKKERNMVKNVSEKIQIYTNEFNEILNYEFSGEWIENISKMLYYMNNSRGNISIIVTDKINGNTVYLSFYPRSNFSSDFNPDKSSFVFQFSLEERKYLQNVFENTYEKYLFSSYQGSYRLFFPYMADNKIVVIMYTDRLEYGKI